MTMKLEIHIQEESARKCVLAAVSKNYITLPPGLPPGAT